MRKIWVFIAVILLIQHEIEAGRRGGGSRSSSGGWFGSGRKSSSSSRNRGSSYPRQQSGSSNSGSSYPRQQYGSSNRQPTNYGSSYPKQPTNTGSSYPKQQYGSSVNRQPTNTAGNIGGGGWNNNRGSSSNVQKNNIGGGGWSNNRGSNTNNRQNNIGGGGWNNRNNAGTSSSYNRNYYQNRGSIYSGSNYNTFGSGYGRQNYGYSGGGVFNNHYGSTGGLFGGGKRSFALGAGAGFLGGAMAGVAAMSMFHQYRMYQSMRYYGGGYGGYGGYGGGYGGYQYGYGGHRRGMLLDEFDCLGGCPMNAFCDYGVCRCRSGYDARYGSCWNRIEDFNRHEAQWNTRQNANYNPNGKCVSHGDCRSVDMNMVCQDETCQCRQDMQWNEEALECQIYIDVNCTDVETVETPDKTPDKQAIIDSIVGNATSDENEFEFDDSFTANLTDDDSGKINVTLVTAEETLANSELATLNPNTTNKDDMRKAFCRDVARVARSYEQTLVPPPPPPRRRNYGGIGAGGILGSLIPLLVICCGCFICWKFMSKIKEACCGSRNKQENYDMAPANDFPQGNVYPPPAQNPYPPPVQNPYPPPTAEPTLYPPIPTGDPGLPPLGPAIPPTVPGYPANPDPNTPYPPAGAAGAPPYPPVGGAPPYPPGPVGGTPYPPAPGGAAPPPYAAQNPYPVYPPA